MRFDFKDKKVVITGAAGVIGRRIAADFAAAGALLCLSDNRAKKLAALPRELGLKKGRYLTHATELTDAKSIETLVRQVAKAWRSPDIVVNNAGIYPRMGSLLKITTEAYDQLMDVNLRAPFLVSRDFANLMAANKVKGTIINISSGASRRMGMGSVPYCTSKTAIDRLTKGFALELAPLGIRVNAVEPGFAAGSEVSLLSAEYVKAMMARIPMGRASGPHDAPNAILFLCSEAASFITGATLAVDGGNSIGTFNPDFYKKR
ncbi:MAG: SDR family oxidoreductase [Alphaproteobacteria bacterium]|nr:SDR family oxidoreductase [Alphaproteobacteria bacterium]